MKPGRVALLYVLNNIEQMNEKLFSLSDMVNCWKASMKYCNRIYKAEIPTPEQNVAPNMEEYFRKHFGFEFNDDIDNYATE